MESWKVPGADPQIYAIHVDDKDIVWVSQWGANSVYAFDPKTEQFKPVPGSKSGAEVRQILAGQILIPESGNARVVIVNTAAPVTTSRGHRRLRTGVERAAERAAARRPEQRAFQVCISCHSLDPAVTDQPGPNLNGIIGRPIAVDRLQVHRRALQAFAKKNGKWTPALIERFIQNPRQVVPGTRMEQPSGGQYAVSHQLVLAADLVLQSVD